MKLFFRLLVLALWAVTGLLSARVILQQDFNDASVFPPGPLENGAAGGWRVYRDKPEDFTIVTEPAASAPHALKVLRQTSVGYAALRFRPDEGYDFTFDCKILLTDGNGVVIHFIKDGVSRPFAGLLMQCGRVPQGYTSEMVWKADKGLPMIAAGKWFVMRMRFDSASRCNRLALIDADGQLHAGEGEFPVVVDGLCDEVRFINILPQGGYSFIDDVVVTQADAPAMADRVVLNERASSPDAALAAVFSGKNGAQCAVGPGTPAVIEFSPAADLGAIMLQGADGRPLPPVTVKALNFLGHWIELANAKELDANGLLMVPPTQKVTKLTLDFAAAATLSSCSFYSPASKGQSVLNTDFAKKLDAEFRLPVYDLQYAGHERAQFTFVNHTEAPLPVIVAMQERGSGKDFGSREVLLPPGKSDIYYDLKEMPNGEYLTRVIDNADPQALRHGMLERLLRLRTSPPCAAIPRREVTGQKIFFPDGFYLSAYENIDFVPGVAEKHLAVRGVPGEDDKWIYFADDLFIDKEGRIRINFHTMNRLWQTASRKEFSAVALDESMDKWEVTEGRVAVPPQKRPMDEKLTAAAKPDWQLKPGPDGNITYRFYDAEKDGPVKLNQINLNMISPSVQGTYGYKKYDWKILDPAPCTIWPVWYKAPGEAVILSHAPLVESFPPSGSLEPPNSGSDLGFGQWLSDDGKTLYMGHGRHIMRYMPYVARFDCAADRARIVAVWRTTDGLNWEQNYVAPPSDNKPLADQSYGGQHFNVPDGAGLRLAFFNRYSAYHQQISWELIYSWDSFRWTRFQDKPQFLPNGPQGDFFCGGGYVGCKAIEKDGRFYQLMTWVNDHYHFQSEIVHGSNPTASIFTADYMKRRYEPRHLEEWPYFQERFGGSWEKLAEHTRNATSGFGVIIYRKDGYFSADAGEGEGRLVTMPFVAKGGLKMNAIVEEGGHMKVRLLRNGTPLEGYERELAPRDGVDIPLFDKLPVGEFQVEITMKNARLYTLQF